MSFSNGWQGDRNRRWDKWLKLIQRDPNYSRILFGLPLLPPIRPEVLRTAERLGYRWPLRTEGQPEQDQQGTTAAE